MSSTNSQQLKDSGQSECNCTIDYSSLVHVDKVCGSTFKNFEELSDWLTNYTKSTFTILTKRSSLRNNSSDVDCSLFPYKKIHYVCTHGYSERKRSTGKRPFQSTLFKNCPFKSNVAYDRKNNCYKITYLVPVHQNHDASKNSFMSDLRMAIITLKHPPNRYYNLN